MSVPRPATTNWVPLQGRPSGAAYFGQYQASGHTYYDGDCVIGSDGILYMCVTDGTTTAPIAWPGAAAPQGVAGPQGPAGVGIPSPVVNGSWIKGVSGAAVWTPIVQGDLPANLQAQALGMPGDDYNQALSAGWYFGSPSSANRPGAYWCHVQVFQFGGPQYKQVAQRYDALDVWDVFTLVKWLVSVVSDAIAPSGWINVASNPGYVNGFADYGVPYGPA